MMSSVKYLIKEYLYRALYKSGVGVWILHRYMEKYYDPGCIILLYHQIVDGRHPYLNKGPVVHHKVKDFSQEICFLKKNFDILSMDEVITHLNERRPFNRPSVAITFDDGYLDNYTLAWPILRQYEVPATIYLTTDLINSHNRTWTDLIELALLESKECKIILPELFGDESFFIDTIDAKIKANIKIAEALKIIPDVNRNEYLCSLYKLLNVDIETALLKRRAMLNWDEIREMASGLVTFGSHSHTHPILSKLPIDAAKDEILKSKSILEEYLQKPAKHFAYPNGRVEDFSEDLRNYCADIGFASVATVLFGNNYSEADPYSLLRVGAVSPIWNFAGTILREFVRK